MRLCLGTVIKLIYLCGREKVSTYKTIGEKLFPDYDAISEPLIDKWKKCDRELNSQYCRSVIDTDLDENIKYFIKIANEVLDYVLDPKKVNSFIVSLLNIIKEDETLDETYIGYDKENKKEKIIKEQNIESVSFLSNIIYYIHTTRNNRSGKEYINKVNENYITNAIKDNLDVNISTDHLTSNIKKNIVDYKHPFTYNSNSTKFSGYNNELLTLNKFVNSNQSNIRWLSLSGPGGSGKSRLAYEFSNSLDKNKWDIFTLNRDTGISFNTLLNIINITYKNVFILVDIEISDMESLAKWMSYQYSKRLNIDICILICQRTTKYTLNNEMSSWYSSIHEYNEIVQSFEYDEEIILEPLNNNNLEDIFVSYIQTMYPDYPINDNLKKEALKKLKEVDPNNLRPLYLLFIADALANNIEGINNEDSLLNYAFLRERNYIRTIIKDAFGCDYLHNKQLYDSIEEAIANNSLNVFDGDYNEFHCFELANMSEERFKSICDLYGLTINGKIKPIQPDLLAEYFYIRYSDRFVGTTLKQSFWLPLFRDFNYLLTTKYRNVMKQFFPYCLNSLGLYYIEGIYEAFCTTNSDDERIRLLELAENYEEDFKEWVGNNPIIHPSGSETTLNWFYMMHEGTIENILSIMKNYIIYKDTIPNLVLPTQKYDVYDSFVNDYARHLYIELFKKFNDETNAFPLIDKLNEFTKLYENTKQRENEVASYYVKGLVLAIEYFFNSSYEYEDELASQIARIVPTQLKNIYQAHNDKGILKEYIYVLAVLFNYDRHEFYKKKEDILIEIEEMKKEYNS